MALKNSGTVILRFCIGFLLTCVFPAMAQAQNSSLGSINDSPATPTANETQSSENKEVPQGPPAEEKPEKVSFETSFLSGVQLYREKKYDEARLAFEKALEERPQNVPALTNLALVQFQRGEKAWAIALLRRAHNLNPQFSSSARALEFIVPQLDVKEIPHEVQMWESFRSQALVPVSLNLYLAGSGLFLLFSGWQWLGFFGRSKEAAREEKPAPSFPWFALFTGALFVAFSLLAALKSADLLVPRATVVVEKASVQSAPGEKSVSLFDLYAGHEVILGRVSEGWVQVTYPGAQTGWVPQSSIYQTSGSPL